MNYQKILQEIQQEVSPLFGQGKVADYIPALAEINPKQFAMSITLLDGTQYHIGPVDTKFSIQSISKVFALTLALEFFGKELYARVGVEPSGDPFNSLIQLEYENGIPRNPFINAGAIVIVDALLNGHDNGELTFEHVLRFVRNIADDKNIQIDSEIADSEMMSGYRNLALASLMKSFNNLSNYPITVLETYFKQCAIAMNTKQLSRAMLYLANAGTDPVTGRKITATHRAKRINAIMLTCGHYDASGEFAFNVGLPGKSGVGGGIVSVVPGVMGICVYAPELNSSGNSLIGTKALELFTTKTGLSIF
ncbi:MAG: glutaminase [Campylobacterota bacterium]|nr:glutaminase [Campylobacterota bacterium]